MQVRRLIPQRVAAVLEGLLAVAVPLVVVVELEDGKLVLWSVGLLGYRIL